MEEQTETGDPTMNKMIDLNAKTGYDAFLLELMAGARQSREQSAQLFSATIDNVRNLQQAHADHVRDVNTVTTMTIEGTKILQEKGLDTTAHEIAAETASVAAALSAMNGANRQTDSTSAQANNQMLQTLSALTGAINQMQSSLDNFLNNQGSS